MSKSLLLVIGACLTAKGFRVLSDRCSSLGHMTICPISWISVHNEYESMVLSCEVQPRTANIIWWKDGVQLPSVSDHIKYEQHNGVSSLVIRDLKTSDTGFYNCSASLLNDTVSYADYIIVNEAIPVTHPRIVDTEPRSLRQAVRLGTSFNLSCTFDVGSNQSELNKMQWWRNGSMLRDTRKTEYNNYVKGGQMVYTLHVRNVSEHDLGSYECFGENGYGNDSRTFTLLMENNSGKRGTIQWMTIAVGSGAGFVVIVLLVSVAIVTWRRKKEMIQWEEPDLEHYEVPDHPIEYDVFISYSSEDQHWVKGVLFEELTKAGYEVNIDFKDFTPGMAIAENIMDSIYKSRKTVVVMSKNFLKSMWAQFELQQAHNRAIAQRKDVLILIKYGKCKVPAKLLGKTFLDFTDNDIKPHFWKRFYESIGEPGKDLVKIGKENANKKQKENDGNEKENREKEKEFQKDSGIVGDADQIDQIIENKLTEITQTRNLCINTDDCTYDEVHEVSMRPKMSDRNQRLASTESCDSQDSCIGRRISLEERKPLLT